MKKFSILPIVAVIFGFLWSGVAANAQEKITIQAVPPNQEEAVIQQWPAVFDCGPTQIILNEFKGTRGEIDMLMGAGVIQIPGEQGKPAKPIQLPVVQYFNPKTGTFSLIAHMTNGMSCVIIFGSNLQPVQGGLDNRKPAPEPNFDKETLDEKMDRIQPVDPRDIKTIKDMSAHTLAWNT
tara:strand:+ start:80 stop:619 length:540 start_codon:yes stop_codon:yes gene_type:complete